MILKLILLVKDFILMHRGGGNAVLFQVSNYLLCLICTTCVCCFIYSESLKMWRKEQSTSALLLPIVTVIHIIIWLTFQHLRAHYSLFNPTEDESNTSSSTYTWAIKGCIKDSCMLRHDH